MILGAKTGKTKLTAMKVDPKSKVALIANRSGEIYLYDLNSVKLF